jgi:hypothetical protein
MRTDVEQVNLKLSMTNPAQQQLALFKPGEQIDSFKAG